MRYFAKKLCLMLVTLFIVSILSFLALQIISGDPVTHLLGTSVTASKAAALRHELGLDKPIFIRYFRWLADFFGGDGGKSYSYSASVFALLREKIPITLSLTGISFLLVAVISFPIGILIARREGGALSRLLGVINQLTMSLPPFFVGIICTYIFGSVLKIFRPGDFTTFSQNPGNYIIYLFFAALAIALPRAAMAARLLSGGIMSEMKKEYIRTAYSRGNSHIGALLRHSLKNSVPPMITFLALTLSDIIAGSVIIEQVFAIPGMGRFLVASIFNRDFPVVQAVVMLIAFVVMLANFLADMINRRLDPRIEG